MQNSAPAKDQTPSNPAAKIEAAVKAAAHNREPLRQTLQTTVAVAAAYVLSVLVRLPDPSWAVFSAIFVLQVSVGGTVRTAIDRVLGAVLGMIVGLACLYTIGYGEWRTLVSLAVSVSVMAFVSGYRPRYSYGLVAVAMLVVSPDFEMVEGALLRAAAITLGSVCGAVVGALVWPVRAHRQARIHLGRAIEHCSELLKASVNRARSGEKADLDAIHEQIREEMHQAQDMIGQTRKRGHTDNQSSRNSQVRREIDRLWYTLALADRSSSRPMGDDARGLLGEAADQALKVCGDYLHAFGHAYTENETLPDPNSTNEAVQNLIQAMRDLRQNHSTLPLNLADAESLFTLSFAWEQLAENVHALSKAAEGKAD